MKRFRCEKYKLNIKINELPKQLGENIDNKNGL